MARYVPDSEMVPSPSRVRYGGVESRTAMGDEQLKELLWKNGQVVAETRNQRSLKNMNNSGGGGGGFGDIQFLQSASTATAYAEEDDEAVWRQQQQQQLEDELLSWLQFPIDDLHILFSPPTAPHTETTTTRSGVTTEEVPPPWTPPSVFQFSPPIGPLQPQFQPAPLTSSVVAAEPSIYSNDVEQIAPAVPKFQSFLNYSRVPNGIRMESVPRELTPAAAGKSAQLCGWNVGGTSGKDFATPCELKVTASPGASTASGSIEGRTPPVQKLNLSKAEGKRRERELDDNDCQSNDEHVHAAEVKKKLRKPISVRRPRAAEVHNLSERRRRDKINSKLKALQELIPRCNKADKASMLDEAIDYLKSLQLHVHIMSMFGMNPMMYPGAKQQFIAAMGMGMIGMDMGAMNQQPMMLYPNLGFPPQAGAAYTSSFPMPPFPMQPVPVPPTTARTPPVSVQQYQQGPNQPQLSNPSVVDPYQYLTPFQQPQVPPPSYVQNQAAVQPSTTVPSSILVAWNTMNKKTG